MAIRPKQLSCALIAGVSALAIGNPASAVVLQPNEADSDDVFTYQFAGAGFGIAPSAAAQNLDTDTLLAQADSPIIGLLLGTSRSATTTHSIDAEGDLPSDVANYNPATATDVDTGHDGNSWLKFDVNGTGLTADQVGKATLNLWALDGFGITGAFANPSPGEEVETEVYAAAGNWDEQALTWDNQGAAVPPFGAPVDTVTQSGVEQWVSFDVTSLVADWLANPGTNEGFFLRQKDIVETQTGTGGATGVVSSLYASSWFGDPGAPAFNSSADAAFRPFLRIDPIVPEPITATLSMMAVGSLALTTRRRRRA